MGVRKCICQDWCMRSNAFNAHIYGCLDFRRTDIAGPWNWMPIIIGGFCQPRNTFVPNHSQLVCQQYRYISHNMSQYITMSLRTLLRIQLVLWLHAWKSAVSTYQRSSSIRTIAIAKTLGITLRDFIRTWYGTQQIDRCLVGGITSHIEHTDLQIRMCRIFRKNSEFTNWNY